MPAENVNENEKNLPDQEKIEDHDVTDKVLNDEQASDPNDNKTENFSSKENPNLNIEENETYLLTNVQDNVTNDTQQLFSLQNTTEADNNLDRQQLILQQSQNPETGELLVVLQGENGEQIAIPPEAISNGFVQIRESEGNDQVIALTLPGHEGLINGMMNQNLIKGSDGGIDEQIYLQQPLEVSADILNTLGVASIAIPAQQIAPTAAPTNVVQSIETPRVSTQETAIVNPELINSSISEEKCISETENSSNFIQDQNNKKNQLNSNLKENIKTNESSIDSTTESLIEEKFNNIVTNTLINEDNHQNNYVIMTTDDNITLENLSNQLSTTGQTFYLETPEGLVAYSTAESENGTIRIVTDDSSNQNPYIIQNENQLIETTNENGQPITFAISSNSNNEIELLPVNNLNQPSSLLDIKNNLKNDAKNLDSRQKLIKQKQNLTQTVIGETILLSNYETTIKSISSPIDTSSKKNYSIIQNIGHQSQNSSLNRKRIQKPLKLASTVTVTPSSTKSTNSFHSFTSDNDFSIKKYLNNSLNYSTSSDKSESSQLAASRRTYSRKNIVWLNPVQSTSTNSTTNSSLEIANSSLQILSSKSNEVKDNMTITITSVKSTPEKNNQIPNKSIDLVSKSSNKPTTPQVKKGTITISTIVEKQVRNPNIVNQVKIVPSDSQFRSPVVIQQDKNKLTDPIKKTLTTPEDKLNEESDKLSEKFSPKNSTNLNKRVLENSNIDALKSKRTKKVSFSKSDKNLDDTSLEMEINDVLSNSLKTNTTTNILEIKEPEKIESGRRKSPIKPLTDCETNFEDDRLDEIPLSFKKDHLFSNESSDLKESINKEIDEEKKNEIFQNKKIKTYIKEDKNLEKIACENKMNISETEIKLEQNENNNDNEDFKLRRSGRLQKPDIDIVDDLLKNDNSSKKRGRPKKKSDEQSISSNKSDTESLLLDEIEEKNIERIEEKNIEKTGEKQIEEMEEKKIEETTEKRIDEDSLKFDLIFNSSRNNLDDKSCLSLNEKLECKKEEKSNEKLTEPVCISYQSKSESSLNSDKFNYSEDSNKEILFLNKNKRQLENISEEQEVKRRQTISSIKDLRNADENYDIKTNSCELHVRQQFPSPGSLPRSTSGNYMCQKCGFKTNRINNLILHHKDDCQVVKNQMMLFWQSEIKKQTKTPVIVSKKKRILDSQWDLLDTENNEEFNNEALFSEGEDEILKNDNKFGFNIDEIVWVNLKEYNIKWPALIKKIYPDENDALVVLIDEPFNKKRENVFSVQDLTSFNNAEQNIKFLEEGKLNYNDSIVVAVQKAEDYTRKKCLGEDFDSSKILGNLEDDTSSLLSEKSYDEDKSLNKDESERKIDNAILLKNIKQGKIESQLLGIYKGSIESKRHSYFIAGNKGATMYGPFDDEDEREEIFDYCLDLFKNNFKVEENFDVVAYMFEVWVPEVIIKAISRYLRVDMVEAEKIFMKDKDLTIDEKEKLEKEIKESTSC